MPIALRSPGRSTVLRSPGRKYAANFTSLSNLGFRAAVRNTLGSLRAPSSFGRFHYTLNQRPVRTTSLPFRPGPAQTAPLCDAASLHKRLPSNPRHFESFHPLTIASRLPPAFYFSLPSSLYRRHALPSTPIGRCSLAHSVGFQRCAASLSFPL
jgi:hypothetical protein